MNMSLFLKAQSSEHLKHQLRFVGFSQKTRNSVLPSYLAVLDGRLPALECLRLPWSDQRPIPRQPNLEARRFAVQQVPTSFHPHPTNVTHPHSGSALHRLRHFERLLRSPLV